MLLIDGVKYGEWIPPSEDEFEGVVKKHTLEIFGEQSIYLDRKQKLKSLSGIGSIPDGYVIFLGDTLHWHIVEMELSFHPPHEHIVPQLSKFTLGIKNLSTQNNLVKAIYEHISGDGFLTLKLRKETNCVDIYKFLSDLISKPPVLTVIIEKKTEELEEALDIFRRDYQTKIVEFQTFIREGIGLAVHAHLFEPLYKPVIPIKPQLPAQRAFENSFRVDVYKSYIQYGYIGVWTKRRHLFPNFKTTLELNTDTLGIINVRLYVDPSRVELWNLDQWFKTHPELKPGAKLRITVIEPMKKYRLEIVKQEKEGGWRPIHPSP